MTQDYDIDQAIQKAAPPNAILAEDYREDIRHLLAEGIVSKMTDEILEYRDWDQTDIGEINILAANQEYRNRGGKYANTLGAVKWAMLAHYYRKHQSKDPR